MTSAGICAIKNATNEAVALGKYEFIMKRVGKVAVTSLVKAVNSLCQELFVYNHKYSSVSGNIDMKDIYCSAG